MILFGHLGIGLKIGKPFMGKKKRESLPIGWFFLGALLPDLIDKSLYYSWSWATGLRGAELGLISGTRTFGHTALFLLVLGVLSLATRSKPMAAVFLGVATHILIDHVGDTLGYSIWPVETAAEAALTAKLSISGLLWPLLGNHFPISRYTSLGAHLATVTRPHLLIGEISGIVFLLTDRDVRQRTAERLWKRAYSPSKPKSSA